MLIGVVAAILITTVATVAPWLTPRLVDWQELFSTLIIATTGLFTASALIWIGLAYVVGAGYESPDPEYTAEDIQVRVLTIDAEAVVQATVDSLPTEFDDVHVIAEEEIDIRDASVRVVPDEFDCEAVRKGRAIEWARQTVPCDREYIMYLDEDSLMRSFDGLPDADIVQLRERPRRTGSVLSYLADVFRMGVQIEQKAFARLSIPLFAWGGGIAVRQSVEDAVTWNRETLVEDTAFVWAAAQQLEACSFELAPATCANEAPPSLGEITQQRRRWAAGNLRAARTLPLGYQFLTRLRNFAWALSPIVSVLALPLTFLGIGIDPQGWFAHVSTGLALLILFWYLRGVLYYGRGKAAWILAVPLAPVVTIAHSIGTVVGVLNPPGDFRVTQKVGDSYTDMPDGIETGPDSPQAEPIGTTTRVPPGESEADSVESDTIATARIG